MTEFNPEKQPLLGAHSIEASAGTGKTYSITILWLRLLLEEKLCIPIDRILISTFTRAATAELKDRLLEVLREARQAVDQLENKDKATGKVENIVASAMKDPSRNVGVELDKALSNFDMAPIYTIHGFCQTLLSRMSLEMGGDPDLKLVETDDEFKKVLVEDLLMMENKTAPLNAERANSIAAIIAEEMGIDEEQINWPWVPTEAETEEAKLSIKKHLPIEDDLKPLALKSGLKPALSAIEALSIGRLEKVSYSKEPKWAEKIRENLPLLWKDIQQAIKVFQANEKSTEREAITRLIKSIRHDLQTRKRDAGIRCFNDILIDLRDALRAEGATGPIGRSVRHRYQAIIIDECQDSDGIQIEVFNKLFLAETQKKPQNPPRSLIVIGDPKQSIYRFRGADLASYGELIHSMERAPEMKTNYRSDPSLVDQINKLYLKNAVEFRGGDIRYVNVGANAKEDRIEDPNKTKPACVIWSEQVHRTRAIDDISHQFALECQRLLKGGIQIIDRHSEKMRPIVASDIAVLAAKHGDLSMVRKSLQRVGIPCQQSGRGLGKVIESEEANDILVWLEALDAVRKGSGRQMAKMMAFSATPLHGDGSRECLQLSNSPDHQSELLMILRKEADSLYYEGPLPVLVRRISNSKHLQWNLSYRDGERRITNWRQLTMTLQDDWMAGQRDSGQLAYKMARRIATKSDHEEVMRLETDLPAVQLVTLHGSKGLEYPVVFCPTLWSVKSRSFRKSRALVAVLRTKDGGHLDAGSEDFETICDRMFEQEDQELERLLYVALTRPRHRLYVGLAPVKSGGHQHKNGADHSPLARLMGLNELDFSTWKDNLPWAIVTPTAHQTTNQESTIEPKTTPLESPPSVDPWKGPIFRTSSYSSLAGGHENTQDHDETRSEESKEHKSYEPGLLEGLGGGATLGNQVHDLLEQVLGNGRELGSLFQKKEDTKSLKLKKVLGIILDSPLHLAGHSKLTTLSNLRPKAIAEMHFMLPISDDALTPRRLSDALLADLSIREDQKKKDWAESVADWSFEKLRGFLQGFIDLTFEYEGQWWLLDYKTNLLSGYGAIETERAMLEHDYLLQSRLYAVALHRHLQAHLDDYDFRHHFGGCAYMFVRGCPDDGLWTERPNPEGMEALNNLFGRSS